MSNSSSLAHKKDGSPWKMIATEQYVSKCLVYCDVCFAMLGIDRSVDFFRHRSKMCMYLYIFHLRETHLLN